MWSDAADIAGIIVLIALSGVGVLLALFQLPGTWLMLATALVYDWCYGFERLGTTPLVVLACLAVAGEIIETVASSAGAKRSGAGKGASWAALIGGLAGMLIFTPLIPVPIVGTLTGGMLGCFIAVVYVEYRPAWRIESQRQSRLGSHAGPVGWGGRKTRHCHADGRCHRRQRNRRRHINTITHHDLTNINFSLCNNFSRNS